MIPTKDIKRGASFMTAHGPITVVSRSKKEVDTVFKEYPGDIYPIDIKDFRNPRKIWREKQGHKRLKVGSTMKTEHGKVKVIRVYGDGDVAVRSGNGEIFSLSDWELEIIKISYGDHIKDRESKILANAIVASACKSIQTAAYLDGPDANTSNILALMSPNLSKIAINFSKEDCDHIQNNYTHPSTLSVFQGTINEAISRANEEEFGLLWLDYCGSFDGNAMMNPREDIQLAIDRRIIGKYAAFTFCLRASRLTSAKISSIVLRMFLSVYPSANIVECFTYWPAMVFFIIRLH